MHITCMVAFPAKLHSLLHKYISLSSMTTTLASVRVCLCGSVCVSIYQAQMDEMFIISLWTERPEWLWEGVGGSGGFCLVRAYNGECAEKVHLYDPMIRILCVTGVPEFVVRSRQAFLLQLATSGRISGDEVTSNNFEYYTIVFYTIITQTHTHTIIYISCSRIYMVNGTKKNIKWKSKMAFE